MHLAIAVLALPFIFALVVWFIGRVLHHLSEPMPVQSDIEPHDFDDVPCSWCQKEQAIKAQPHESHGICQRHYEEMLADAKRINHAA